MPIDREEVTFCIIKLKRKANMHEAFNRWGGHILAQPGMKDLFKDLGIMKAIAQLRSMAVERNPISSLYRGGELRPTLLWRRGENLAHRWRMWSC